MSDERVERAAQQMIRAARRYEPDNPALVEAGSAQETVASLPTAIAVLARQGVVERSAVWHAIGWPVLAAAAALDDRDVAIYVARAIRLRELAGPVCGDFVRFADGRLERVSNVWSEVVQTSEGGSFYLGDGYVSFSGSLNPTIPITELRRTDEEMLGSCWFFHLNERRAGGGVEVEAPFRVYEVDGVREHMFGLDRDWWSTYRAGVLVAPELHLDIESKED